ncbi:MAG: bacitracin resistance protein BacA [Kiritimatiellia bacterium]
MQNQLYTPPQGPPQISAPSLYEKIGLDRLYEMAWIQYQALGESRIAGLFPTEKAALKAASEKQAEFLCGVMGGPKVYIGKHGPPRMRARHLPFAIDENARQEWLRCLRLAFDQCGQLGLDESDQVLLLDWIGVFSAWMVNRAE